MHRTIFLSLLSRENLSVQLILIWEWTYGMHLLLVPKPRKWDIIILVPQELFHLVNHGYKYASHWCFSYKVWLALLLFLSTIEILIMLIPTDPKTNAFVDILHLILVPTDRHLLSYIWHGILLLCPYLAKPYFSLSSCNFLWPSNFSSDIDRMNVSWKDRKENSLTESPLGGQDYASR